MSPSLDLEFPAKRLGRQTCDGRLVFESDRVVFYPTSNRCQEVCIASKEITDFFVNTTDTRQESVNPLSVYFFGLWAFLFPERSGALSIKIAIQTADLQILFLVEEEAIGNIRSRINHYLD